MKAASPRSLLAVTLVLAGCASSASKAPAPAPVATAPVEDTPKVTPPPMKAMSGDSIERALANYQKLLDLPQTPEARVETIRRIADLELQRVENGGGSFAQSEQQLRKSIGLYEQLLAGNPGAPGNDRVLYQMSRAYQDLGENAKAEAALDQLTREFPQSPYTDDAHFRRAELLYKLERFELAASEYRHVLSLSPTGLYFEPAQYKFGWCEYKLGHYESALDAFIAILVRELPAGEQIDPKVALDGVRQGKRDTASDSLGVAVLSLTAMGGGDYLNKYFAAKSEPAPAFAPLLYRALADSYFDAKRYTDSAGADTAFLASHPKHALAPMFLSRAIDALYAGGFTEQVVQTKERYVAEYDPAAPYWGGSPASEEVTGQLRKQLEELATYYHNKGQKTRGQAAGAARGDFSKASAYYKRLLELFPQDPKAAELNFLMAESFSEAGETASAVQQYAKVASTYPGYSKASEAAYAAVLAYHKQANEAPDAEKPAALRRAVQSSLDLADHYPQHPQAVALLTRAAEDLYQLQAWDEAIAVATRVLKLQPEAPEALRRTSWGVTADAQFSQKRYAEAEAAYTQLLKLTPPKAQGRDALVERLASCIYKQGEAARAANDQKAAAGFFLRVGQVAPGSTIRAASTYDAGAMFIALKDWNQAATVLETFRTSFPHHALIPEVDKKLSLIYQDDNKPRETAAALKRIAARTAESADTRRDAAWLAVALLEQAKDPHIAAEYEAYLKQYPRPLDAAMQSRKRLAELAGARGDTAQRQHWLHEIVAADAAAGAGRTTMSRSLAAEAALEFARKDAQAVNKIALKLPLKPSLAAKKQAMERSIAALTQAADYGIAEVTTAATFELGELYRQFGKSLLASERPQKMSAMMAEQYKLMLQDQAFPFEEKSIQYYESNLQRVAQGVNDEWVSKSLQALAELAPGRYTKREQTADFRETRPGATKAPSATDGRYAHAVALIKTNQWPEAQAELVAYLKDFSGDEAAHTNLGIAYTHTGHRKDLAAVEFWQAVAIDPRDVVALDWLGVLARESGDYKNAEQAYRRALEADPGDANAHLNLAVLYDQYLQRPADALKEYRAYREQGGKDDLKAAVWIADLEKTLQPAVAAPGPASEEAKRGSGT